MNKTTKIILSVIAITLVVVAIWAITQSGNGNTNKNGETNLGEISDAQALTDIISKSYEGLDADLLPMLETTKVEVSETDTVAMLTGLENGDKLEYLVVSQPLMSAQAYSFVLAKVKADVDANAIAKEMSEKVDMRRWICVEAEQLYATNSGDVVCLVMGETAQAQAVYNKFKEQAGTVGQEYDKTATVEELPPDVLN